jgi:hypothetical protein
LIPACLFVARLWNPGGNRWPTLSAPSTQRP